MSHEMPPTTPLATPTPTAALPPTVPTPTVTQVAATPTVTIPLDQLNAFTAMQARLAKVEEEQQKREALAREEQVKILAAKGQVEEALRQQREEAQRAIEAERVQRAQVEERAKRYALDGELARALASQPLVAGGAEQLTHLLRDHFVVEQAGNSFQVRTQDFRSVGDYIGADARPPRIRSFPPGPEPDRRRRRRRRSVDTDGDRRIPRRRSSRRTSREAVLMQYAATAKQSADPRLNPTVPFGSAAGGASGEDGVERRRSRNTPVRSPDRLAVLRPRRPARRQ